MPTFFVPTLALFRVGNGESVAHPTRLLQSDPAVRSGFIHEMKRFLPHKTVQDTVEHSDFWTYLVSVVQEECNQIVRFLGKMPAAPDLVL